MASVSKVSLVPGASLAILVAILAPPVFGHDDVVPAVGPSAAPAAVPSTGQAESSDSCIPIFNGTEWDCIPLRPKIVFVTSATYDGDLQTAGMGLNGLQGADNICNAHAVTGIVPPGHYVAWLSTDDKHARDRLPANETGFALPDGSRIADSKSALLDAENVPLKSAINRDEFGTLVDSEAVWTGSSADGNRHWSGYNCYDWTYNGGGVEAGTAGETKYADETWSAK